MPSYRTITLNGYHIRFTEGYSMGAINGVRIPDVSPWWLHPNFFYQLGRLGYRATMFDVTRWINDNWEEIWDYGECEDTREWFRSTLRGWWNFDYDTDGDYCGVSSLISPYDDNSFPPVNIRNAPPSSYVLFTTGTPEPEEPVLYKYSGLNRSGSDTRINIQPVTEPVDTSHLGSHWYRIMNYTFVPDDMPFLSCENERTHLFFGMELEMSTQLTPLELQRINCEVEPVRDKWFFFKSDSSVTGSMSNRVELVTVPMTPKRMKQEWKILWKKLGDLAQSKNLPLSDVFDMSPNLTNGIHIHLSKDAFVQSSRKDNGHKFRFLAAFNQWDASILKFFQTISRRPHPLNGNEYCKVHPGLEGYTLARRLKNGPMVSHRHSACHESSNTVEVRIFQGIPDLDHILSCMEITLAMFEFTQYAPHSAYGRDFARVFTDWVYKNTNYKKAKEVLAQCV